MLSNRIKKIEILTLILITLALIGYWWARGHVWLPIYGSNVSVNGRSLAKYPGSDYSCFRSLREDIFCPHQDHGQQYLISLNRKEISVVSEDEDYTDFAAFLYTSKDIANLNSLSTKRKLPDTQLMFGNGFIEFNPPENGHWHISN
ncbi:MAG: hypothetical protein ACR2LC_09925 [Pyrinomonadaceae bacterium]